MNAFPESSADRRIGVRESMAAAFDVLRAGNELDRYLARRAGTCRAISSPVIGESFACTLGRGHEGEHRAEQFDGLVCARWPQ